MFNEIEATIIVQAQMITKLHAAAGQLQQALAQAKQETNMKKAHLDRDTARALCDAGYMTHDAYARFCKEHDGGVSTQSDSGGGGHTNPPPPETGED